MAKGDLNLDLTQAELLFDNGKANGLVQAQFTQVENVSPEVDPLFPSFWYIATYPQGVTIRGDFSFSIRMPMLEGSRNYLTPEDTYMLLLAMKI